jgi:type II secretory pathway predicted ATPase ExeA
MNDTEQDNRNAPSYLAHYGMHRPPFADKVEDDLYYAEPSRTQRLDMLLHLTQYSQEILLVTGPEGIGKTTMLHQFQKKAPGEWKVSAINAHPMMDQEQLMYRICHGLKLAVDSPNYSVAVSNLKRRLESMLAESQTVIIAIDNAHILSTGALAFLVDLAKTRNLKSGTNVRILLFAEPQIKIQLASTELEGKQKNLIRKIDLPPFSEDQTGKLIRNRVRMAGLHANNTFTPNAINKIYKQSKGIPGDIVELAHRVLFEMTPIKRRTKPRPLPSEKSAKKRSSSVGLALGLVAAVLVVFLLLFQKEINTLFSGKSQTVKTTEQPRTTQPLSLPPATQDATATESPSTTQAPQSIEEEIAAEAQTMTAVEPEERPAQQTTGAEAPSTEVVTETDILDASAVPQTEQLAVNINQAAWLMEQNPQYFTLQLVAGYQKRTVNNFLTQHKLPATELAYYHSYNKGKDWHSLVYGIYPDYRSAKDAIETLPAAVRLSKPWIRQLNSIQGDIKDALQIDAEN